MLSDRTLRLTAFSLGLALMVGAFVSIYLPPQAVVLAEDCNLKPQSCLVRTQQPAEAFGVAALGGGLLLVVGALANVGPRREREVALSRPPARPSLPPMGEITADA